MRGRLVVALAAVAAVVLATGVALAATLRPQVDRQVTIPVRVLDASEIANVGMTAITIPEVKPAGRAVVELPALAAGDEAFGAATWEDGDLVIVVVIVDPTPEDAPFVFRQLMPPLTPPRPMPDPITDVLVKGLPVPAPKSAEVYAGASFLGTHGAPPWCKQAPMDFTPSIPLSGVRRDPALTWGGIDVLCNHSSAQADAFRALFHTAQPAPPPATGFSAGLTFDWNHGVGHSNLCGFLTTTPPQPGAQATESLMKPDNSSVTKSFTLDASGTGYAAFDINQYGPYSIGATVTANGVTKTASGQVTVTSQPGKGVGCPAP